MTRRRRPLIGAVALVLAWLAPGSASAQDDTPESPASLPVRQARFSRDATTHQLQMSVSYRDVVDASVQQKLQSGVRTVIVFRGYVFPDNSGNDPAVVTGVFQSCRIAFDVWNEVYRIQISQPTSESTSVALNMEGVLRRCAEVRNLPIRGALNTGGGYFLAATVEVNPVSQDMLEQIRRWVSRPPGSSAVTPGDSIFGSFVGLFVARIGRADRSLSFRTNGFTVPP